MWEMRPPLLIGKMAEICFSAQWWRGSGGRLQKKRYGSLQSQACQTSHAGPDNIDKITRAYFSTSYCFVQTAGFISQIELLKAVWKIFLPKNLMGGHRFLYQSSPLISLSCREKESRNVGSNLNVVKQGAPLLKVLTMKLLSRSLKGNSSHVPHFSDFLQAHSFPLMAVGPR
jgi:hypothetical protein